MPLPVPPTQAAVDSLSPPSSTDVNAAWLQFCNANRPWLELYAGIPVPHPLYVAFVAGWRRARGEVLVTREQADTMVTEWRKEVAAMTVLDILSRRNEPVVEFRGGELGAFLDLVQSATPHVVQCFSVEGVGYYAVMTLDDLRRVAATIRGDYGKTTQLEGWHYFGSVLGRNWFWAETLPSLVASPPTPTRP